MRGESDVLIVGAGPAGAAAGILLARAGVRVAVVDRARFPRDKTCGDALSNRAVARLADLGVLGRVLERSHATVRAAHAILPDGTHIERRYPTPGLIVPRLLLDAALRDALEQSGAEVMEGVSVRRVVADPTRPRALGAELDWRARVVLAADGPGSVAWEATGRSPPAPQALGIAITTYLEELPAGLAPAVSEHYFERFLPSGYGWVFPAVDGASNVGVYQTVDAYKRRETRLDALLAQFLAAHPERFRGAHARGRERTWQLPLARPTLPPSGPGLLTLGDAARLVDPLSGEGIWHALESGFIAAQGTLAALERGRLDAGAARAIAGRIALRVGVPAAARRAIQLGLDAVIRSGVDDLPLVKKLLTLGYGSGALDPSHARAGR
ncbi:MAG: geranylgeranyl reductase family protein [Polyangiaceae bacterium]|nr:geranylgeranyl reductase family protein [Polyangiaceae bacterium]